MSELEEVGPGIAENHRDLEPPSPEVVPYYGDVELIRTALSQSVEERLAVLQDFVDTFWTPQHG